MLAPDRALALVLDRVRPIGSEPVSLVDALDRTLAEDLVSASDLPGFDNSAMDGYAVHAEDTEGASESKPCSLKVVGESRAGAPAAVALGARQAIRISTGAMVPDGADAVVRVELVAVRHGLVELSARVRAGQDVRRADDDAAAGDRLLARGTLLGPAELAVACSIGAAEVPCARRPSLAAIATGDELVEPGETLGPGQIRNSNAVAIPALAQRAGAEVRSVTTVCDDRGRTIEAIGEALGADLLVLTGGVSVGPHDHVKAALAELGVEQVFWRVALRPGKPTWFGVAPSGCLVFGLPGNPVSAIVTFGLFAAPAIAELTGRDPGKRRTEAVFDEDYAKKPGRAHVVRCRVEAGADGLHARPTKAQGSHVLTSMLDVDALAYLDIDRGDVQAGERVEIELQP